MPDELFPLGHGPGQVSIRGELSAPRDTAVLRSAATVFYFATIAAAGGMLISKRLHEWPDRWARCPMMNSGKRQGRS